METDRQTDGGMDKGNTICPFHHSLHERGGWGWGGGGVGIKKYCGFVFSYICPAKLFLKCL